MFLWFCDLFKEYIRDCSEIFSIFDCCSMWIYYTYFMHSPIRYSWELTFMTCLSSLSVLCSHYGPIIGTILSSAKTSATLRSVGQRTADTGLHMSGVRGGACETCMDLTLNINNGRLCRTLEPSWKFSRWWPCRLSIFTSPRRLEAGFSNDIKFAQETDCDGDGNSSSSLPGIMCKIKFS